VKIPSANKEGKPKKKQKTSHAHEDQGGISANIPNETSQHIGITTNLSSRGGKGREIQKEKEVLLVKVKVVQKKKEAQQMRST